MEITRQYVEKFPALTLLYVEQLVWKVEDDGRTLVIVAGRHHFPGQLLKKHLDSKNSRSCLFTTS
jgi:hypothetical protein